MLRLIKSPAPKSAPIEPAGDLDDELLELELEEDEEEREDGGDDDGPLEAA